MKYMFVLPPEIRSEVPHRTPALLAVWTTLFFYYYTKQKYTVHKGMSRAGKQEHNVHHRSRSPSTGKIGSVKHHCSLILADLS